jgi:hypothetical protein
VSHPHDVDAAGPALQQPDRGVKRPARRGRTVIPDDDLQEPSGWRGVCGIDPRLPLQVLLPCLLQVRVVHGDASSVLAGFPTARGAALAAGLSS